MSDDDRRPEVLCGIAALLKMLGKIGDTEGGGDKTVAHLLCDNELALRELAKFAIDAVAENI